jgi:hypothetical protein
MWPCSFGIVTPSTILTAPFVVYDVIAVKNSVTCALRGSSMKIHKYGIMILREGAGPDIRDWEVEREPEDPTDATDEQLLLGFAITWARARFEAAVTSAAMDVFRKMAAKKRAEAAMTPNEKRTLPDVQ